MSLETWLKRVESGRLRGNYNRGDVLNAIRCLEHDPKFGALEPLFRALYHLVDATIEDVEELEEQLPDADDGEADATDGE